jgi:hypothetical protein
MPRFRAWPDWNQPTPPWPDHGTVREIIADAFWAEQFYIDEALKIEFAPQVTEEIFWELFQGRALDRSQTRRKELFIAWNAWDRTDQPPSDEPLLSVKWSPTAKQVHVTRSILCRAWEGYSDETGAILSRETVKRVRELVGTIELSEMRSALDFRDELIALLFYAVVGNSRLPLTSVESPLPQFVMGQLMYCYQCDAIFRRPEFPNAISRYLQPDESSPPIFVLRPPDYVELIDFLTRCFHAELAWIEKVKLFELALRQPDEECARNCVHELGGRLSGLNGRVDELTFIESMFNEISLSPYCGVMRAALWYVRRRLEIRSYSPEDEAGFLSHLLRQTGRHLAAFDLVRFHHRGANYPDALMVEEILPALLNRVVQSPEIFLPAGRDMHMADVKRLRRRGLRHGLLIRQMYRGHAVPDAPTSPGENARVWPQSIPHIPEEQILDVGERHRRLFEADWDVPNSEAVQQVTRACFDDLNHPAELRELGTALFLDRPLGVGKRPTEPDRTLLFSYVAFSRTVARNRLRRLAEMRGGDSAWLAAMEERLRSPEFDGGVRFAPAHPSQRPGTASLDDSLAVADDFVFLRSTRRSVEDFLRWYDVLPLVKNGLGAVIQPGKCLMIRSDSRPDDFVIYDENWARRAVMRVDLSRGFVSRIGVEHPVAGLRVMWISTADGDRDCSGEDLRLGIL